MKIVVVVKQVPDPTVIKFNVEADAVEDIYYILNPCDKVAVEGALRIKDEIGEAEVTAITFGPSGCEAILRACLTMGADRAIRLWDQSYDGLDSSGVASILGEAIKTLRYDVVLCGKVTIDDTDSYVGPAIAELLSLPQVSAITKVQISPDRRTATVHRRLERGDREVVECSLPAVFTVDDGLALPRYASLPTYLAGVRKAVEGFDVKALFVDPGKLKVRAEVIGVTQPKPRLKKGPAIDSSLSAADRMNAMMFGAFAKENKSDLVEKTPDLAAGEIIRFLRENKIIE
ncbi:MAG: electron transfer flavoprotein subunit beta/FixA family protein [Chloroflexi bacterium]|nr:electron transfer flavoprotein subunit beta/FixA family protein [Chloroflexota bacterium]